MVWVASKTFYEGFGTPLVLTEKIRPPRPKEVDFGGAEISTKPILTIFGQKKFFDLFFELVKGHA